MSTEKKEGKKVKFYDEPIEFGKPIVTKGRVFAFPLKSNIRDSRIKKGNCTSIVWDDVGYMFYGVVVGDETHIFQFDSNSMIEDVGKVDVTDAKGGVLVFDNKENIVCAVVDGNKSTKIFKHNLKTDRTMYSHMWGHFVFSPIEDTCIALKGEAVVSGTLNSFDGFIYLLTERGNIFQYSSSENKINMVSGICDSNLSFSICGDPENGDLYGVTGQGRIWRLVKGNIELLNVRIPCMKNRNYLSRSSNLVWFNGNIYGGTLSDAYLFEFNIKTGEMKNLGRPDENAEIRGIDVFTDGRVFGVTATEGRGMGRIFCYSAKLGFEDIGIISGYQPIHDFSYEPLCIKAGSSGEFLIGNGESRANIFLYCSAPL